MGLCRFRWSKRKHVILFDDRTTTGQPLTASDVRVPFWRAANPETDGYTESGRRPETVLPGNPVAACGFTDTEFRGTAAAAVFATQSKLLGTKLIVVLAASGWETTGRTGGRGVTQSAREISFAALSKHN